MGITVIFLYMCSACFYHDNTFPPMLIFSHWLLCIAMLCTVSWNHIDAFSFIISVAIEVLLYFHMNFRTPFYFCENFPWYCNGDSREPVYCFGWVWNVNICYNQLAIETFPSFCLSNSVMLSNSHCRCLSLPIYS